MGWLLMAMGCFVGSLSLGSLAVRAADPAPPTDEEAQSVAHRRFREQVAPLLSARCLGCHNGQQREGGLSLATAADALQGGDSGEAIRPGDPDLSPLLVMVSPDPDSHAAPEMPKNARALSPDEVMLLRDWIQQGAFWPAGQTLSEPQVTSLDWWSLRPLTKPPVPEVPPADQPSIRTPIDAFILHELHRQQMRFSPEADRRTLIRRISYDLTGLPPSYDDVEAFVNDPRENAYEVLVERLLDSPEYGERWARHWLDVVHYGDTHGYDKDKPRPNAWPYRDYVIRSFNADKPYARFVREQIAGDVLWPDDPEAIEATGFIAAGPWDFIGHAEVPESKYDGQVARNLDRDDMVSSTINTFLSVTVQCARCHNHKFDPITQEHYYSLQAVFAAVDRADRVYDRDPQVAARRRALTAARQSLREEQAAAEAEVLQAGGEPLAALNQQIAEKETRLKPGEAPEFGYHSEISPTQDVTRWVQVDLGSPQKIGSLVLHAASDSFAGIGDGFGFPVRFRIEGSSVEDFSSNAELLADFTGADFTNPRLAPVVIPIADRSVRFVRVTATKLAPRQGDYIFVLAELEVLGPEGRNLATNASVTAFDSIEAPPRWRSTNLTDGIYAGRDLADEQQQLADARRQRDELLSSRVPRELLDRQTRLRESLAVAERDLQSLPAQQVVYAGTVHHGSGAFVGTGASGGKPREIRILQRGELKMPGELVQPGTLPLVAGVDWKFALDPGHTEGQRRIALADWLVRPDNGLLWRSIVNRVWLYHFGRGLVDSANDFGRMGELPTHPELLEWLAIEFRDGRQSLKDLHRLIVNSRTYRQSSANNDEYALRDVDNRFLWRMNRQMLTAEAIRDSVLVVSGRLDRRPFGPAFMDFVIERPEHSPHYEYQKYNPDDVTTHRRSIYRFLVRSQQQPFMQSLGCADPSQSVAKRDSSLTSLQALTLLNNAFMVRMSEYFAERVRAAEPEAERQAVAAFRMALARNPSAEEAQLVESLTREQGLPYACRVLVNLNEFVFVD
jgi:hypothetical protein